MSLCGLTVSLIAVKPFDECSITPDTLPFPPSLYLLLALLQSRAPWWPSTWLGADMVFRAGRLKFMLVGCLLSQTISCPSRYERCLSPVFGQKLPLPKRILKLPQTAPNRTQFTVLAITCARAEFDVIAHQTVCFLHSCLVQRLSKSRNAFIDFGSEAEH